MTFWSVLSIFLAVLIPAAVVVQRRLVLRRFREAFPGERGWLVPPRFVITEDQVPVTARRQEKEAFLGFQRKSNLQLLGAIAALWLAGLLAANLR